MSQGQYQLYSNLVEEYKERAKAVSGGDKAPFSNMVDIHSFFF